jgi:hypothetical protein
MLIVQDVKQTKARIIKAGAYCWQVIRPILGERFQGGYVLKFETVSEHRTKAQARKALAALSD